MNRSTPAALRVSTAEGTIDALRPGTPLPEFFAALARRCEPGAVPLRLALTHTTAETWRFELDQCEPGDELHLPSMFEFRRRGPERTHAFTAAMVVPTGVDCTIGGHAGDATPAARVLAAVCDELILHPNVVNASDVNEAPSNSLYVEGSVLARLLMGTVGLRRVRSNRVLVVTEERSDGPWAVDQVVNVASAARATLGLSCAGVVTLRTPLAMRMTRSASGRAIGSADELGPLLDVLLRRRHEYDAVALATRVSPDGDPRRLTERYYRQDLPNPWGGAEAVLSHVVSLACGVPVAHAPTLEDLALRTLDLGQVDPRKAAEAISTSFLFCVLKGLWRAPRPEPRADGHYDPSCVGAEDVSCLVVPRHCVGIPTLAALAQGIRVIAVDDNTSLMSGDLSRLPFAPGQLLEARSYLEAAGLLAALRAGVAPEALARPLPPTRVSSA